MAIAQNQSTVEASLFWHLEHPIHGKLAFRSTLLLLESVYYLPPFHWQSKTYLNSSLQYHTIPKFYNIFLIPLASFAWGYHCLTLSVQFFVRQMPKTVKSHFLWSSRPETEMLAACLAKRLQVFQKKTNLRALTICPRFYSKQLYFGHLH